MGLLRAPSGDIVTVPDEQVESSIARGYTPVSAGEAGQTTSALPPVDNGALGALGAAATSTLSGLTLGASDVALRALLTKGQADQVAADRAAHPVISGAGQFAGNLLPAFAAPESLLAKTPAGLTSSLGRTITEHAAGEGAGLGTRILAGSTGAAAEGAIYGGGQYLSDTALEDKPLSAEGFVGAMGHGALFAAPIGGALTAGEAALLKVRSLFPSAAITPEAARTAQQEATSGIQQAVSDGDQMAEAVKQKIALTDAQTGMAQAGEQVTRRVFGAADPASIVDQATGGATRAQLSDALDKFEASKAQLQDWIQSEADPELEQALTNLRSPKLQITGPAAKRAFYEETQWPPELPSVRHTPDDAFEASMLGLRSPDVQAAGAAPAGEQNLESLLSSLPHGGVQREAVPVGEFGAPGKGGIKSPEELEQALREAGTEQPSASVPSASSLDSTRAGKRGGLAEGTPAQAYAESPPPEPARPKYAVESVEDRSSPRHITQTVEPPPGPPTGLTKTDRAAGGTQGGAWYRDEHGRQWFGKEYGGSVDRVENEHLANDLYRMFGVDAPETHVVDVGGKKLLVSREVPGSEVTPEHLASATNAKDGFVMDAWLANWDAVGKSGDNMLAHGDQVHRVDNGGATIWRAMGGDKEFKAPVGELESMRHNGEASGKVFGQLTDKQVDRQLIDFADRYEANKARVFQAVDESGLSGPAKKRVREGLRERADWLLAKADALRTPATPMSDEEFSGHLATEVRRLPPEDAEALRGYTGNGAYGPVNSGLRESAERNKPGSKTYLDKRYHEYVDHLDQAIARSPAPRDMVVYRGVNGETMTGSGRRDFADMKPGDTFTEHGFVSTSADPKIGNDFSKGYGVRAGVELHIAVPKGFPAAPVPSDFEAEKEFLLPRGAKYRVNKVEHLADGTTVVHVTVATPDPLPPPIPLPSGFNLSGIDKQGPLFKPGVEIRTGVPVHSDLTPATFRDYAYVVKPSELIDRGILGKRPSDEAIEAIRKTWQANGEAEPIQISMQRHGGYAIENGNDRLFAAATDGDRAIVARFWPSQSKAEGVSAIGDDLQAAIKSHVPTAAPEPAAATAVAAAPATDTLTGLLRGTKSKLDAGASLNDIGAPSRAEYAVAKQARTSEAAEHFRSQARAAATPPAAAAEPASELEQLLRGTKQGLDSGAGMRDIGEAGRAMRPAEMPEGTPVRAAPDRTAVGKRNTETNPGGPEDLRQFADRVGRTAEPPIESGVPKTKVDPEMRGRVAEQESIGKTIVDHGMRGRVQQATDDEAIAKLLGKREGKGTDIGPGLARAAKAIGDYEEASAGLVDALGPEAPPSAAQRAKTYRESTAAQADATGASAARATQDINDKLGPAVQGAADKTVVDDSVAKALRLHEARQAGRASGAAKAAPRRAAGATKAASALEVLKAFGVHIPVVSAIPVIGPILGAYLKAKAIMSVIGRKGGGIGRTVEGIVAAKSATTRNRIADATKALLDVSAKGVKKVSAAGAGPLVTLAGKLFPGGANPSPKDPQALYQARMDEIQRALAPGAIDHAIGDRIQTSNPALHDAVVAQVQRGIQFLDGKAPKQSVMPGMLPGDGAWHPSKAALEEFGRYVHAVNDPASVLEDLAKGTVTLEGAETLRTVYPGLYAEAQRTLLEAAPKMATTLPYPKRVAISIMYQVPVDGTMSPSHMQFLQPPPGAPAPASPPPHPGGPAIAGQLLTGQQTMTSLDRRAGA